MNLVRAIYPGTFDPLTNGHLDLIERGSKIFDELIVGILSNTEKDPLFNLAERLDMSEHLTAALKMSVWKHSRAAGGFCHAEEGRRNSARHTGHQRLRI